MAIDEQQIHLMSLFSEEKIAADILDLFRMGCCGQGLHFCKVKEKQDIV